MNKARYHTLCEEQGSRIPLFQQHWWMEAVCMGKEWDVLLAERQGRIEGALPYLIGKKYGLRYILQPQLTQFSGPWIDPSLPPSRQRDVMTQLVQQLNSLHVHYYQQCFSPTVSDHLPFHWAGYQQTTRYTYRFPSIADPAALQAAASRARRQNMSDVATAISGIDENFPTEQFQKLHRSYFEQRKGHDLLPPELITRVCNEALRRQQGLLWALRDKHGHAVNASFVVYDDHTAYALMSAITPDAPRNSQTYLFWRIIEHLSSRTKAFDFEGSMEQGNEYFYRSFGAVQMPYHCVWHSRVPLLHKFLNQ